MLARAPQDTDNSSVWHLDHRARGVESKCAWGSWVSRTNECRHVHHKIWEDLLQIYRCIHVQVHMSLAIMCTFICACMSTFLYTCMMVCTWVCVCLYSYTHSLSLSLSLCCLPIHSPRAAGPLRPVQKKKMNLGQRGCICCLNARTLLFMILSTNSSLSTAPALHFNIKYWSSVCEVQHRQSWLNTLAH